MSFCTVYTHFTYTTDTHENHTKQVLEQQQGQHSYTDTMEPDGCQLCSAQPPPTVDAEDLQVRTPVPTLQCDYEITIFVHACYAWPQSTTGNGTDHTTYCYNETKNRHTSPACS